MTTARPVRPTTLLCVSLLGVSAATACGGYGVKRADNPPVQAFAAPRDGSALVCMFRAHGPGVSVITPVSDNRQLIGATKGASYFCYGAEPGEHLLAVDDAQTVLHARAGERYYYYHEYLRGPDRLVRVTDGTANALAGMSEYTELDETPQGVPAPAAVAFAPARARPADVRFASSKPVELERRGTATAPAKAAAPSQTTARAAR